MRLINLCVIITTALSPSLLANIWIYPRPDSPNPVYFPGDGDLMSVSDFNVDGNADLLFGSDNTIQINFGDGNFGTSNTEQFTVEGTPNYFLISDLTNNNRPDIIFFLANEVQVILNNDDGTFSLIENTGVRFTSTGDLWAYTDDVNEDGLQDLFINERFYWGDGDGTFRSGYSGLFAFDYTGDGKLEIIRYISPFAGGRVEYNTRRSDGTYSALRSDSDNTRLFSAQYYHPFDSNGDGIRDIFGVSPTNASRSSMGETTSAFGAQASVGPWGVNVHGVFLVDLNNDGTDDRIDATANDYLLARSLVTANVNPLHNSIPPASLQSRMNGPRSSNGILGIGVGDFNGDGISDVAALFDHNLQTRIYAGYLAPTPLIEGPFRITDQDQDGIVSFSLDANSSIPGENPIAAYEWRANFSADSELMATGPVYNGTTDNRLSGTLHVIDTEGVRMTNRFQVERIDGINPTLGGDLLFFNSNLDGFEAESIRVLNLNPDGSTTGYDRSNLARVAFDFGDGFIENGTDTYFTYNFPMGETEVVVVVEDINGNVGQDSITVTLLEYDSDNDGLFDGTEYLMIQSDPFDDLVDFSDVLPTDDFDGDGYPNISDPSPLSYNVRVLTFDRVQVETTLPSFVTVSFQLKTSIGFPLIVNGEALNESGNIRVRENGENLSPTESYLQIANFFDAPSSLKTVILLDNSFSVGVNINDLKDAATSILDAAIPGQEFAVYSFSEAATLVQPYTADHEAVRAAIDSITLGFPTTNLYGSIIEALTSEATSWQDSTNIEQVERGFLVVLTDGSDTAGVSTLPAVLSARGTKNVYTIGVGNEIDPLVLQDIGNAGFFTVDTFTDLRPVFEDIQQEIELETKSFYWLSYVSPRRGDTINTLEVSSSRLQNGIDNTSFQVNFSSSGFSSVAPGIYLNRDVFRPNGVDALFIGQSERITADTLFPLTDPANYSFTSGDSSILLLTQQAGDSVLLNPLALGTTTFTVVDEANSQFAPALYEKTITVTVVETALPEGIVFSESRVLEGGWFNSEWFGIFQANAYPWILHQDHNWLQIIPDTMDPEGFYIFDPVLNAFFWTRPDLYPFMFFYGGEEPEPVLYEQGTANPRFFIRISDAQKVPEQQL